MLQCEHDFDRLIQLGSPASVTILGAGSWGTALAALLANCGHHVTLWARDPSLIAVIRDQRINEHYLPNIPLPESILPTADIEEAVSSAQAILFAIPSGGMREVAASAAPFIRPDALLVSASKGLEDGAGCRMSQILADVVTNAAERTVALSGPNLAVEVARGAPTASVVAAINPAAALAAQRLFSSRDNPTFRVYTSRDVVGVELGGAVKNVIAIAAGVCDGQGFGDNSKAALMTRGLTEAIRLGVAQGAEAQTFLGLSGVGDLIATGGSRLSRNYRVGYGLGQGRPLGEILAELGQVAEGVPTTRVLHDLAVSSGIEMPLCSALREVLFEDRGAAEVIRELMRRPPKEESPF